MSDVKDAPDARDEAREGVGRAVQARALREAAEALDAAVKPLDDSLREIDLQARLATEMVHRAQAEESLRVLRSMRARADEARAARAEAIEARFAALVEACAQTVWTADARGERVEDSPAWRALTGQSDEQCRGCGWLDAVHPEERAEVAKKWATAVETRAAMACEFRLRDAMGAWRWTSLRAVPMRDPDGAVRGWLGTNADITEQRADEAARRELHLRLVTAQEDERRHIARELHDQMGQLMAAMVMGLRALEEALPRGSAVGEKLWQMQQLADQIGREVHDLALALRPTALDDLGLEAALRRVAEDWSRRSGVQVELFATGGGARLPTAVETALYRVVQEALTNIAKHARATRVSVVLERRARDVVAIVEDDGKGFDVEAVGDHDGVRHLGLLGMRERLGAVGGSLEVESFPGRGTALFARVPLVDV